MRAGVISHAPLLVHPQNVYGGTDYLPRMLKVYAAAGDHVLILIAEDQDSGQADGVGEWQGAIVLVRLRDLR